MPKAKAPELIRFGENVRNRREELEWTGMVLHFTDTVIDRSAWVKIHAVEIGATLRVQFVPHRDWFFICSNMAGDYETPVGTFRDLYVRKRSALILPGRRLFVRSLIAAGNLLHPC